MFTNVWYVAARSDEVAGLPHHVRMLGRDFVLYRDPAGAAHCLSNCVHRRFAHNAIDGTACPFHAWRFDKDGAVRKCVEERRRGSASEGGVIPPRNAMG
jgi:phenylpropionate dioxygenase-like ring-hydroxylating dioxygenase large terminal subunit